MKVQVSHLETVPERKLGLVLGVRYHLHILLDTVHNNDIKQ